MSLKESHPLISLKEQNLIKQDFFIVPKRSYLYIQGDNYRRGDWTDQGFSKGGFFFCIPIPSSGHLRPMLNRKVLEIVQLFTPRALPAGRLWLCNFGSNKSDLNLGANSAKLFLRKPLGPWHSRGDLRWSVILYQVAEIPIRLFTAVTSLKNSAWTTMRTCEPSLRARIPKCSMVPVLLAADS